MKFCNSNLSNYSYKQECTMQNNEAILDNHNDYYKCNNSTIIYKQNNNKNCLDELKNKYYKNRYRFEKLQYKMNIDEIKINNIILDFEEKTLFDNEVRKFEEKREKKFMQMFTCCNEKFETLADFARHKENMHEEATQEENLEIIDPEYKYVPIKLVTDDLTSSGEGEKCKQHRCTVEGCFKTYTSAYGLRYHTEKGHSQEVKEVKPHKCTFENCTKRYKNVNGLKYHLAHAHKT